MMRFPLFCVAALLSAAVSAPAQITFEGRIGRHIVGSVVVGHHDDDDHRHRRVHVRHERAAARGHWRVVEERVLVPGYWREEHVPPTYGWIPGSCGRMRWGIVDPGGCRKVWVPARWETRTRRVWTAC